jgi:hypothetical protein
MFGGGVDSRRAVRRSQPKLHMDGAEMTEEPPIDRTIEAVRREWLAWERGEIGEFEFAGRIGEILQSAGVVMPEWSRSPEATSGST